jgi:hypothetical protein
MPKKFRSLALRIFAFGAEFVYIHLYLKFKN